ncbi:MAG: HNH endonuclease [Cyanobacteria bacterium P01_F01_bin.3]
MNLFEQAGKLAIAAFEAKQQADQAIVKGAEGLADTATQAGESVQQQLSTAGKTLANWQCEIAALGTSGMAVANALKDLPRTAQALAEEMPKLARRLQTAGTRLGDAPRTEADVMGLFNKIPGTSKLGSREWDIRVFLSDKHGSHIHPHSTGGSNGAENIVWEIGADNIRRGAKTMTGAEQRYIRFYNAIDSILKNSTTIAKLGVTATGTAVLTQALVTALAYTLDLHRGEITTEEFRGKITEAAISAGVATPVFFVIFVAVMALFPQVAVVLSTPAVVAGFNTLFGVSIALPIVQSFIRHVEADGLGSNTKTQCELAIARGEESVQQASQALQQWWRQCYTEPLPSVESAPPNPTQFQE